MNQAQGVAGDDFPGTGEGATILESVAGEGGHNRAHLQVPHLQYLVIRTGDRRPPPVPTSMTWPHAWNAQNEPAGRSDYVSYLDQSRNPCQMPSDDSHRINNVKSACSQPIDLL